MYYRATLILIFFLLFPLSIFAQVQINEFLIDPHPQQVELLNFSTQSADISHWHIDDSSGSTYFTIPSDTILPPFSCFVFSSDFSLNKASSDIIRLFDSTASPTSTSANIQDSFSYKLSPGSGISFQRIPDASPNWATGPASIGLWNNTQLTCLNVLSPTITIQPSATPTSPSLPTPTIPEETHNVFISEFMANPQTGEKEWVELYNDNNFEAHLDNWYIDDIENSGSAPVLFSLSLMPYQYVVIDLQSSILNNDADQIRLLDSQKHVVDYFTYDMSEKGFTLSRESFKTDQFCTTTPTKGFANSSCSYTTIATLVSTAEIPSPTPFNQSVLIAKKISSIPMDIILPTPAVVNGLPNSTVTVDQSILGTETVYHETKRKKIPHVTFLFPSISFAFLTIVSVFLRMRTGL